MFPSHSLDHQASSEEERQRTGADNGRFTRVHVTLLAIVLFIDEFWKVIKVVKVDLAADCLF